MRILIVEDDRCGSIMLEQILSPYGSCTTCDDGRKAVAACTRAWEEGSPFDMICMDILMPNMDGNEALSQIRAQERARGIDESRRAKVIMITALDDSQTIMDSFYKAGATTYVVKPITKRKILEAVKWNRPEKAV